MQHEENTPGISPSPAQDEFHARNVLLGYVLKISNGRADLRQLNTIVAALTGSANARIGALEADLAECIAGSKQAWGICDDVAAALGDDLDRDAGSAVSLARLKKRLSQLENQAREQGQAPSSGQATATLPPVSKVDPFLAEHLRLWKDEGVPAPVNELQSINAWLRCLASNGKDETLKRMRSRTLLLMTAANALHEEGPDAEDAAGIYANRPRDANDKES